METLEWHFFVTTNEKNACAVVAGKKQFPVTTVTTVTI
jgi:hypothetical protein